MLLSEAALGGLGGRQSSNNLFRPHEFADPTIVLTTKKLLRLQRLKYADSARWLIDRNADHSTNHAITRGHASCSYPSSEALMATQVVARDDGRIGDEMTLAGIAKQLEGIREDLTAVRSDIKAVQSDVKAVQSDIKSHDGKFQSLDGKLTALDHKMTIEFEETKRLINLSFESTQMLREEVGRGFDEAEHANAGHRSVLEAAIVGLSRDMKKPRRPGRRR